MPVANTSTNYTGRAKDISVFQTPDPSAVGPKEVFIGFGKHAKYCAGVQKLIQRYAIILLSGIASQPNYPEFGTAFMPKLKAGISPTDKLAAMQIFASASYDAVTALRNYQIDHPDMPLDEKIVRAELSSISLYGSAVSFNVLIYTEAGETITFLVPIPK